jgi:hypothetical protein
MLKLLGTVITGANGLLGQKTEHFTFTKEQQTTELQLHILAQEAHQQPLHLVTKSCYKF